LDPHWLIADLDLEDQTARLTDWVGSWDPCFSIARPPRDALLYEPDATLYGIALGTRLTINLNHRERALSLGDAIVVPPGLSLQVEPAVDLLAVSCAGAGPDHFRERFIQVWGFDLFRSRLDGPGTPSFDDQEIIPAADLRYHLSYTVRGLGDHPLVLSIPEHDLDLRLVLALQGGVTAALGNGGEEVSIPAGQVLAVEPGLAVALRGIGLAGVILLVSEPVFHARRALKQANLGWYFSPEAVPRRHNPGDPDSHPSNQA
jgi:hypothetical protein